MEYRTIEKGFWQYISNIRLNSAVDSMSQSKVKQRRRQGVSNILEGVNVRAIQRHGMGIDARRANQNNVGGKNSSFHWESFNSFRGSFFQWVLSNSFSLNFLRQSQYRAKVHPGMDREGSWNTNNNVRRLHLLFHNAQMMLLDIHSSVSASYRSVIFIEITKPTLRMMHYQRG